VLNVAPDLSRWWLNSRLSTISNRAAVVSGVSFLVFLYGFRFERMALARPLFCDITWHPAGDPGGDKPSSTMAMANVMLNYCGLNTVMHITCCRQSKDEIREHLDRAKEFGLRNLVALRGGLRFSAVVCVTHA